MKSFVFLLAISFSGVSALRVLRSKHELAPSEEMNEELAVTGGSHVITIDMQDKKPKEAKHAKEIVGSPDVWAFFTTTRKRVKDVAQIVEGLKAQTYPPSHIIINCGTGDVLKQAGLYLQNIQNVSSEVSNQFLEDIGPGTKYPSGKLLDQVPDGAYVYIGDDDRIYDKDTIKVLVAHIQAEPEAAHGKMVRSKGDTAPGHNSKCGALKVQFPLAYAYAGLMLKKEMLVGMHEFFEAMIQEEPKCKFVDDVMVSGYLARSGVEIKKAKDMKGMTGYEIGDRQENGALVATHDRGCENKACQKAIVNTKYPSHKITISK